MIKILHTDLFDRNWDAIVIIKGKRKYNDRTKKNRTSTPRTDKKSFKRERKDFNYLFDEKVENREKVS